MANVKISADTAATTPIAGTALVPIVQSGANRTATIADVRNTPEPFVMSAQSTGSVTSAAAGTVKFFARSYGGRVIPEFMNEAGIDAFCQPAIWNNHVFMWSAGAGTTPTTIGGAASAITGTASAVTYAATSIQGAMRRHRYATTTTAGNTNGVRSTDAQWLRGNVTGVGGFFAFFRFTQSVSVAATQAFVGLYGATTVLGSTGPGNMLDMIGLGYGTGDATGTGWRLFMNDATGTATAVNLTGAPRDTTTVLDLTIYCPANSSNITVRVYNQSTQTVVLDNVTYTTDLPTATTFLYAHAQVRNGATTSATNIELSKIYIESDI